MMDFIGKICPYCKTEFKEGDDVVVCSVCEMPHHKECWIENKACTTFGCTGTILGANQYAEAVDNKSFCSKCGTAMNEGQKFCASCGMPAGTTGVPPYQTTGGYASNQTHQQNTYTPPQQQYSPPYTPPQQQYSPSYTPPQQQYSPPYTPPQQQYMPPYTAPQYNSAYNPYGQQQQHIDQDLYSFIQSNQPFYIEKFQKMQMTNSSASWNWGSFFFGALWLAYRKMYGIAAAYAGIAFFLGFIPGIGSFFGLAMSVCAGIFGNYFYKQYIDGELQVAKRMDDMNKNFYIAKKGGTSAGAVGVVLGIMFLLVLITTGM